MSFPKRRRFGYSGFPVAALVLMIVTAPLVLTATAEGLVLRPVKVEVVNDTLNQPYNAVRSAIFQAGFDFASVSFEVPEGKRLVIETITVSATLPVGQDVIFQFSIPGTSVFGSLTVQAQADFGTDLIFKGTHPIKIRVDGSGPPHPACPPTSPACFKITANRSPTTGVGSMAASVHGYLVPLPTP